MIKLFKSKPPTTVLGLAFDGNRLEAAVVRRSNGSLHVQQSTAAPLALSLLSGDPQLVGRELRNHLEQAGIRERRCVVCLPLNWVLTLQVKLPDLPEADIASFLQIEAERGFPSGHENLFIATSRLKVNGEQFATLMGIPRNHLESVQAVLKAAQLKPLSFSLGITALAGSTKANPDPGVTLALAHHGIDLQVSAGGGIAALRSLDAAVESEGAQRTIDADLVAREIRITFGQLPPAVSGEVHVARVFGRGDMARQFMDNIARKTQSMGLRAELMERASDAQIEPNASSDIALSPAVALAGNYLRELAPGPELLPPRISRWQQMMSSSKFSSQKLVWAGAAGGAIALIIAGAFVVQAWEIASLQSQWHAIEPKVTELTAIQNNVRQFRPYYDRSYRALQIMRALTQAFPEEGDVTAKTLEIRELNAVTCTGIARDNQSYLRLLDKLRANQDVSDLKTESLRGQSPSLQFTLNFQWGGGSSGN